MFISVFTKPAIDRVLSQPNVVIFATRSQKSVLIFFSLIRFPFDIIPLGTGTKGDPLKVCQFF
jgi:hypothetical protein